jgi:hypothetical protein
MSKIQVGDKVRIKDRPDWVSPPGYRLANSEGSVIKVWEPEHKVFQEYIEVRIEKTTADIKIGTALTFRVETLEKI